jgi:hypothetical protein
VRESAVCQREMVLRSAGVYWLVWCRASRPVPIKAGYDVTNRRVPWYGKPSHSHGIATFVRPGLQGREHFLDGP